MLTKLGQRGYAVHETGAAYGEPIDPDTDTDPDPERTPGTPTTGGRRLSTAPPPCGSVFGVVAWERHVGLSAPRPVIGLTSRPAPLPFVVCPGLLLHLWRAARRRRRLRGPLPAAPAGQEVCCLVCGL